MPENSIWVYIKETRIIWPSQPELWYIKLYKAKAAAQKALAAVSLEQLWMKAFDYKNRYFIAQ